MLTYNTATAPVNPTRVAASAVHERSATGSPPAHAPHYTRITHPHRIATQTSSSTGTGRGAQPRTFRGRDGALHVPIARHAARRHPPLQSPSTPTRRDHTSGTAREENPATATTAGGVREGGGGELQRRRGSHRHCCACSGVCVRCVRCDE